LYIYLNKRLQYSRAANVAELSRN